MSAEEFGDAAIALLAEYSEHFGMADADFPEDDPQEQQCIYEEKFLALICRWKGHEIGPDMCGKPEHDLCYRCRELRVDLEE